MDKKIKIFCFTVIFLISGCATVGGSLSPSKEYLQKVSENKTAIPINPMDGQVIWGNLKVGMTAEEALKAIPNSKFDDNWSSGGVLGAMAEAGILADNKIKVNAEINGPFNTPSNLYVLFDEAGRLDGIVILTISKNLPEEVKKNYGAIGYYLTQFKDAAKIVISKYALKELGERKGPPKFGKEQMDSLGSVGVATPVGKNMAFGVGISTGSISPSTIAQIYDRPGYKSILSIRCLYLGLYNVYASPIVFMAIQAKTKDDVIEDF
jgi:hypothetical protein